MISDSYEKIRQIQVFLLICLLFLIPGCQEQTNSLKEKNQGQAKEDLFIKPPKEKLKAERKAGSFSLKAINYRDFLDNEKTVSLKGAMVLAFNPDNALVYEDVTPEDLAGTRDILIENISTGKSTRVQLDKVYPYIDGARLVGDSIKLIATDLDGNVDYISLDKGGGLKVETLTKASKIAVNLGDQGFILNIDQDLGEDSYKTIISQIPYANSQVEKLVEETYQLKGSQVVEGQYLSNVQELQGNLAWQALKQVGQDLGPVENTQIFFKEESKSYHLPFIKVFCSYLGGTEDFILALKATPPDGRLVKNQGTLYMKEGKLFKPYSLPGYERSNFIRMLRQVDKNLLWVQADRFMDFIRLDTKEIYRLNQDQEAGDSFISFGLEGSTLYRIGQSKDGRLHLTYGQALTDKLQ